MPRVRGAAPLTAALLIISFSIWLLAFADSLNPVDAILGRGAIVEVPDFTGDAQPRAEAEVRELGLEPTVSTAFSLSQPRGTVMTQTPAAGARVRRGDEVELVVSRGENRVAMPDAVGRQLDEVTAPLDDAAVPIEVTDVFSETEPDGVVVSQDPEPGVEVTGEDVARFEVSKGPAQRPVPATVGLTLAAAGFRLGASGLVLGDVTFVENPDIPQGAVASTDPVADTVVDKDTPVAIAISSGGVPVTVPSVVDQTESRATATLRGAGFVVNVASRLIGAGEPGVGAVFDQSPAADENALPGSLVTIVVGRAAAPPPTTTTTQPPATTTTRPRSDRD